MYNIDYNKLPKHIGIILDGNGRWAKKRGLPRHFGHKEGSLRVLDIVKECHRLGVSNLSLYAFSTENWKRPKSEIEHLMKLLSSFIQKYINEMNENGIKLCVLGDISSFDPELKKTIENAILITENNTKMTVNIALNYGGQDEILMATKEISKLLLEKKINIDDIDKELFESFLYTSGQPPLDLLIRPSGELRVSNFMLYQMAYAEFIFLDILWPDFREEDLRNSIIEFQNRNRRFGGL